MKEIKRYKLVATESARNVIECDDGHWVHYSNVEQLQARIKELESDAHINEIKAQGIEEAIQIYKKHTQIIEYAMAKLNDVVKQLRAKHD